jgi:adenylate cyclase
MRVLGSLIKTLVFTFIFGFVFYLVSFISMEGFTLEGLLDLELLMQYGLGIAVYGIFFGLVFSLQLWRSRPFSILTKTALRFVVYVLALSLLLTILWLVYWNFMKNLSFIDAAEAYYPNWEMVISLALFHLMFTSFVQEMIAQIGPAMFPLFLFGKYISPKKEQRIFAFVELADCDRLISGLGETKFQKFKQEFFSETGRLAEKYRANLYKYWGDGVFLTWDLKHINKKRDPINFYRHLLAHFLQKNVYFREKYGHSPVFRIGIDGGQVEVLQIGASEGEITFSGSSYSGALNLLKLCREIRRGIVLNSDAVRLMREKGLRPAVKVLGSFKVPGELEKRELFVPS